MGAPTQSYVDPSIAGDSGAGTSGDPWGDLQYGLDQVTRDSTDGDQFNIKNGTDEILAAALSLATYGTPTQTAPLIFRGYTSAADDGGIGGISGNGSVGVMGGDALDFIHFYDLHMHNCGSTAVISLDNEIHLENCEINNTTGAGINIDADCSVSNCYVHNVGGAAIFLVTGPVYGCYVANGTNECSVGIQTSGLVLNNVINLSGSTPASDGIKLQADSHVINNSIFSNAGTGQGITPGGSGRDRLIILNNIVEGFSGSGGIGIDLPSASIINVVLYGMNAVENCATDYVATADITMDLGNNESLSASPFANAGSGDFTVDTTVKATGYPLTYKGASTDQALDKGAAQRVEAGGSGGVGVIIGG